MQACLTAVLLGLMWKSPKEPELGAEHAVQKRRDDGLKLRLPGQKKCNHASPQGTPTRATAIDGQSALFYKCPVCRKEYPVVVKA